MAGRTNCASRRISRKVLRAAVVVAIVGLAFVATPALAADGTGTIVVSPTYVVSGSTGNYLTFTYTVGAGGINNGDVTLLVPTGWTAPGNGFSAGGIGGSCSGDANNGATESGQLVTISGLTLGAGSTCTIQYGINGFNSGDTAPSTAGPNTFTTQEKSTAGGTDTNIAIQPVVTVGNDGTGTMVVSSNQMVAGTTGNTLTFTYTATRTMSSGQLTIAVPAGWPTPSTTASAQGATTSTCGSVGISGSTIQVTGVSLSINGTCTVTYGNKSGGPGLTAPTNGGPTPSTFTTQQEATNDANLIALAASPQVSVTAGDGAGTILVSPTSVIQGSSGNYLTFTYTAPAGGLDNGTLTLLIPSGWTAPGNGFSAGGIGGSCSGDANNGATESGQLVTISGLSLTGSTTCTIDYGINGFNSGDTAPSTEGANTFTTQEASTATGTLTNIATQPVVNVGSDGTGTMVVSPTHAVASSTGNTLTFTYTAGVAVSNGEVTIAVPAAWSAPSTTASAAGATTSTCGTVGISGSTIQVTGVNLSINGTCAVTYGDQSGGPGATAPSSGGPTPLTFPTQEKSGSGGTLTTLGTGSPSVTVTAGDGSGTVSESPSTVITSSTGNDLTFTYTAPAGGLDNGTLTLLIPSGWTAPGNGFSAGGIGGSCSGDANNGATESGQLVTISGLSLTGSTTCTIDYGISGFNSGDTAPSTPGPYTFTLQEASTATGTLTNIATQPVVNVGSDGLGTMVVSPTQAVVSSSGNTLTFTYTAAGTVANGEVTVDVPAGWSSPTTTASAAGATTSTCGTVGISGSTIQVTGVNLSINGTCTVTYGNQASGPGATAPASGGSTTFTTQEESSSGGTLTTLGTGSPSVIVTAADGTGTMTESPSPVATSSTGNELDFTYTAPVGGLNNGVITLLVPTGWPTPDTNGSNANGLSVPCTGGSPSVTAVGGGNLVTIPQVTIASGNTCVVKYGINGFNSGVTAPSTPGPYTFTTQEASTAPGTLTTLGSSPVVTVATPSVDGKGTLTVAPLSVSAGATGQTLTFTYTATTVLSSGELTVALPSGWSPPSTTGTDPGFTSTDCSGGTVGGSGSTIQVTGIAIGSGASCSITYGATTSGGPGATATSTLGTSAFPTSEESNSGGSLTALAASPQLTVFAPDGSGTLGVAPAFVGAGSGGNTLTFTYTAPAGGLGGGQLTVAVPAGWSAPSTTPQASGYTTSTCGSVVVTGSAIDVTGVSLPAAGTCTITYGDTSSGATGATAPSVSGGSTFATQEQSTVAGNAASIASSPQVEVPSADGAGTMAVAPTVAATGSTGNTLTFTFTAAAGGLNDGEITVNVPPGWSAPSATTSAAGYTTAACGAVGVSGTTIQVAGVTLTGGGTCAIVYGSKASGGPGAAAPSSDTNSTFTTTDESTAVGTLTALSTSPRVTVSTAPVVSRTLTVAVTGSGTVTGGGISCPGSCSKSYSVDTMVPLTATPANGFAFSGWGGACSGTAACNVTLSADESVSATFTARTHVTPPVTPPAAAACTLKAVSSKVQKPKKRKHGKPTVALVVKCDQAVSATLTGSVTEQLGKKHGKKRTKVFALGPVHSSLGAGVAKTLTLSFPASALSALANGKRESASFTLTATNANGRRQVTVAIRALKH